MSSVKWKSGRKDTLLNTLISFVEHFNETRVRGTLPARKDTLLNTLISLISFALEAYRSVHVVFHRC